MGRGDCGTGGGGTYCISVVWLAAVIVRIHLPPIGLRWPGLRSGQSCVHC
jgi:hypothetical protein